MNFWTKLKLERRRIRWANVGKTTRMFFIAVFFIVILSIIVSTFSFAISELLGLL